MAERLTRIAIVSEDKCKPKKCRQECKKSCPVVKTGNPFPFPSTHSRGGATRGGEWSPRADAIEA